MAEEITKSSKKIASYKGVMSRFINQVRFKVAGKESGHEVLALQERIYVEREKFIEALYGHITLLEEAGRKEDAIEKEKEVSLIDEKIELINNEIAKYLQGIQEKRDNEESLKVKKNIEMINNLEKIHLPKFNGKDYFRWRSIFDVTVHNQQLSNQHKMLRLLECLEGEPLSILKNYPPTDESYGLALSRLSDEYGGNKRIIRETLNKVRNGKIIEEENLRDLREFLSTLEAVSLVMKELPNELAGQSSIFECARERLSLSLIRKFTKWALKKEVSESFSSLIEYIKEVIYILASTSNIKSASKAPKVTSYSNHIETSQNHYTENKKPLCLLHKTKSNSQEYHYLNSCNIFKGLSVPERRDFIYKNRLCSQCLKGKHISKECFNDKFVCKICPDHVKRHHYLLHENKSKINYKLSESKLENHNCTTVNQSDISLQSVPVIISNGSKGLKINALLDIGSNASFISRDVIRALGLKEFDKEIKVLNTVNKENQKIYTSKVQFNIKSIDNKVNRNVTMFTSNTLLKGSKPIEWLKLKHGWEHLKRINFPKLADRPYHEMLIGTDLIYFHRCLKEQRGGNNAPIAKLTPLGWSCAGPISYKYNIDEIKDVTLNFAEVDNLDVEVRKMWELDAIGLNDAKPIKIINKEEQKALQVMNNNLEFKNNRYEAPILWRSDPTDIKNNYFKVYNRSKCLQKNVEKKPEVYQEYNRIINDYLNKGYISELESKNKHELNSFYIPHFPIVKKDRLTTKTRIVFDCAAKFDDLSLNDRIYTGPKYQNDIIAVLLRFRKFTYGLIGDISEMYLQIGLSLKDRRYCRFLWNNKIYEWNRTLFGRSDSPFIALYVIRNHALKYQNKYENTVDSIINSMYIDDLADSRNSETEIETLVYQCQEIFKTAGMNIKKWLTNSKKIMSKIPNESKINSNSQILDDILPTTKMLGLSWNSAKDQLYYNTYIEQNFNNLKWTKRLVLKTLAKIYDPLGYLDPFLISAKILFQCIWAGGHDWDEIIPEKLLDRWNIWVNQIKDIPSIKLDRHINYAVNSQIHIFCDSSKEAYSAVAYLRVTKDEKVHSNLIFSKTRVTPLKSRSIPQLELMGASIAVRIGLKLSSIFNIDIKTFIFWTDSINVLYWLKRPAKYFKPFVSNRVGEIQTYTNPSQWRHCGTKQNPADLPTRGVNVLELKENRLWWNGPSFLKLSKSEWPVNLVSDDNVDDKQFVELKINATKLMSIDFKLHPNNWSNLRKLLKRLSYVNRFLNNCRKPKDMRTTDFVLTPSEWFEAESILIKICQNESFPEEIKCLNKNAKINKNSSILKLNPFLDPNKILRSKSRLQNIGWLEENFKFPIILPRHHPLTKLIVQDVHEKVGHTVGTNATLNELHKRFWIIKIKAVIKEVQNRCMKCKINKAKPVQPKMAPIPTFRLRYPFYAFSVVGLDFAGPFITKSSRGKPRNKRYLSLFTCLQTRAVHLEMTYNLETNSFMNALSRMIDRRGCPREILTDNGSTYIKAEKEIASLMLDDRNVINKFSEKPIKWKFNPPYASNFGGIFETMIKASKRALYCILSNAEINDEELITAFCHVESLLNSRPITTPSSDINDNLSLTPNHFLIGRVDPGNLLKNSKNHNDYLHPSKRWKYIQVLLDHYWQRWQKELVHQYLTRTKWSNDIPNVKIDQIVIVLDPISLSGKWRLGKIVNIYPGEDKIVRVVDVLVEDKVYRRPVNKLCPLEC